MAKIDKVKDLVKQVESLSKTILLSTNKRDITRAFDKLKCIITGSCICNTCDTWDKDVYIVYELGRCLVPTRFFQLVKERHYKSPRWAYIQELYRDLYMTVNDDILPETGVFHSSGTTEDQKCMYSISDNLKKRAIQLIKKEKSKSK